MATVRLRLLKNEARGKHTLEPRADKYFAKAIAKAFTILEIFRQSTEPLSLNQVTQKVRWAKSSVFRIIHTLRVLGYVEKSAGERYILSPLIASVVPNRLLSKTVQVAAPVMKELSREFRETISLAFLFENHIEVISVVESPQKVQMGNIAGSVIPPHASSLGKCIAATQPEWRREKLLRTYGINQLTPYTITDEVQLQSELDGVREQGFAVDMEESTVGGCCFGAPIFAEGNHAIAAISVSMPKIRLEAKEKVIAAVKSAAAAISKQLRKL